jgi:hypothetical protein
LWADMEPLVSLNSLREERFGGLIGSDSVGIDSAQQLSAATSSSAETPPLGSVHLILKLRSCYPGWKINVNDAAVVISYSFQIRSGRKGCFNFGT